ncbi:hypothetical protein CHUAL_011290 [Chamberlinius hualienensis]
MKIRSKLLLHDTCFVGHYFPVYQARSTLGIILQGSVSFSFSSGTESSDKQRLTNEEINAWDHFLKVCFAFLLVLELKVQVSKDLKMACFAFLLVLEQKVLISKDLKMERDQHLGSFFKGAVCFSFSSGTENSDKQRLKNVLESKIQISKDLKMERDQHLGSFFKGSVCFSFSSRTESSGKRHKSRTWLQRV